MAEDTPLPRPPTRDSHLHFRVIDEDNWCAVAELKPHPAQEKNLSSNIWSLSLSHYSKKAWARAVYADDVLVGFIMMGLWPPKDDYWLWRFMIDKSYQGLGFGKRAVALAIQHVRETYPAAKKFEVVCNPEDHENTPFHFYTKLGFKQEGGPDEDGEVWLSIDL